MKKYCAYTRVSTVKQGERGVSLQEQSEAIKRYAQRHNLEIEAWFEERETAAKRGRPIFNQMLKLLRRAKADGVIIHKIDRSARNLKDWADLGEMIDQGIEVHFANESLDLHSRGGRLSADIQAVVAADYIRNLREETRKGFYGRIKQGIYPLPAPVGYQDKGAGKPKEPDPSKAPLVRKTFELYATGGYSLDGLTGEMYRLGLRNRNGGKVTRNGLSIMLNNPFYMGLIRLQRTNETFAGAHRPLIGKLLFDRVQAVLAGKTNTRIQRHDLLWRRLIRCKSCGYSLIGEMQKGHIYYRCHTKTCPPTCMREEVIEDYLKERLLPLQLDSAEKAYVEQRVYHLRKVWNEEYANHRNAQRLALASTEDRLGRLTDAYIDRMIDQEAFEQRKTALLMEKKGLEERLAELDGAAKNLPDRLADFLELAEMAYYNYEVGLPEEKRDLVKIITSNRVVETKDVDITLSLPFREVANRWGNSNGRPQRDIPRTWDRLLHKLLDWFKDNPAQLIESAVDDSADYAKAGGTPRIGKLPPKTDSA
jgi:site-specific DNA recombinase